MHHFVEENRSKRQQNLSLSYSNVYRMMPLDTEDVGTMHIQRTPLRFIEYTMKGVPMCLMIEMLQSPSRTYHMLR